MGVRVVLSVIVTCRNLSLASCAECTAETNYCFFECIGPENIFDAVRYVLAVCMMDGIWKSLFSRIRFCTAGFTSMISWAATRPFPPVFGRRH